MQQKEKQLKKYFKIGRNMALLQKHDQPLLLVRTKTDENILIID